MAGERALPGGAALEGYFTPGSDSWHGDGGLDENWRKIGAGLASDLVVKSRTTVLPGSGSIGDIYIVRDDDGTNPNKIAVWDGPAGSEAWVFYPPYEGLRAYVQDGANPAKKLVFWDGTAWASQVGIAYRGCKAIQTAAQSIDADEVVRLDAVSGVGDDGWDTDAFVHLAPDNYIEIPAAFDGQHGILRGGFETAADQAALVGRIERSVDSGGSWDSLIGFGLGDGYFGRVNPSVDVILRTGDRYRFRMASGSTVNSLGNRLCFFSLTVLGHPG